ncbi:MAG: hypothetical protein EBR02_07000 [Alphaproteobacteria bacterium]|nr:hypothetical protein [Alphaproteobacteria bacterium]
MAGMREQMEAAADHEASALIVLLEKLATGHNMAGASVQIGQAVPMMDRLAAASSAAAPLLMRVKEQLARLAASPDLSAGFRRPK